MVLPGGCRRGLLMWSCGRHAGPHSPGHAAWEREAGNLFVNKEAGMEQVHQAVT